MTPKKNNHSQARQGEEFTKHRWNVFKFEKKTGESILLGVVNAKHQPDALKRGWDKFKVPYTNEKLKEIYVRRK